MTKLKEVSDVGEMAALIFTGSAVLNACNEVVSRAAHEAVNEKKVPSLSVEEIHEHIFIVLGAFLKIRADANGNYDILLDWERVIKGREI